MPHDASLPCFPENELDALEDFMKNLWKKSGWIIATILGSVLFALGFSLFLEPNSINTGGSISL